MSVEEVAEFVGADSLAFISIEGLHEACKTEHTGFCDACFSGDYPVVIPPAMQTKSFLPENRATK